MAKRLEIEYLLDITLTPIQTTYRDAVKWLINQTTSISICATGRTFLLAVCYIEEAERHRTQWINYMDHYPSVRGHDKLEHIIKILINKNKDLAKRVEYKYGHFRIN